MPFKLFGKNIDAKCEYCQNGKITGGKSMVLCRKKGVVNLDYSCRHFLYDPLKRTPRASPPPMSFDADDFKIE